MTRGRWKPPSEAEAFVPWKPTRCADCPAPHPSYSLNGMAGPWRCKPCNDRAPRPAQPEAAPLAQIDQEQARLL